MVNNELIWIPYNTPALKNSKVKTSKGIFSSPTVKKYLRKLGIQSYSSGKKIVKGYVTRPNEFEKLREQFEKSLLNKEFPVLICFHFIRDSNRLFDFGNATEIIFDLLTAHDIIPDDNISFIFPSIMTVDGILPNEENIRELKWYSVNKENPGVWIKII
jgi:hypothetical protein